MTAKAARTGADAAPGRFAAFSVAVGALAPLRDRLDRAGVPHAELAGGLVAPSAAAVGVALAFAAAPCHSGPGDGGAEAWRWRR